MYLLLLLYSILPSDLGLFFGPIICLFILRFTSNGYEIKTNFIKETDQLYLQSTNIVRIFRKRFYFNHIFHSSQCLFLFWNLLSLKIHKSNQNIVPSLLLQLFYQVSLFFAFIIRTIWKSRQLHYRHT